jgi:DNA-binding GntR family transcriptional regulator
MRVHSKDSAARQLPGTALHTGDRPLLARHGRLGSARDGDPHGGPVGDLMTRTNVFGHPLDEPSLVDRATTEIRQAIVSGQLRPGQVFSLRTLAGQLGFSFIPVREALRGLEREGLVVINRGRSSSVAPLTSDDLHSLCQLRRRIEPELAGIACLLICPEDLDMHELRLQQARQNRNQPEDRYEAHRELLRALLGPAATTWDLRTLNMLWHATERYLRFGFDQRDHAAVGAGSPDESLGAAQVDLIRAFRGRDPREVKAAMLHHIDWAERIACQGITTQSRGGQISAGQSSAAV